jgi:hypothetical protein
MRKHTRMMIAVIILFISSIKITAQSNYSNFLTMSQKINALSKTYPELCSVKPLIKTAGGKEIWVLTIGTDNKDSKPGIAVFGGVEGNHIIGKELASGFAELLLKESSSTEIKALLQKITFYVFPDVSPDATEQFFSDLKFERKVNTRSTDDDKDFAFDEDPYEDLNHDGFISLIRISDPAGNYIESKEDSRVMVHADLSKGESGKYLIFTEGIDNDKDGVFNEDGPGGVDFNRNFSFNYEEFGVNSGMYPISEPETKAVADFLFNKFNIYAVFIFGPQDNLGQPMKSSGNSENEKKITSVMKSDEIINKLVSDRYHEITGAKGAPLPKSFSGDFMDWAYFHYGRYSFSTPAWWFPAEKGKSEEVAFLKFADKNKISNVFIPWSSTDHPDFPGKKTEIGGIRPFVMINPPADTLGDLIAKNYRFITSVASMHPELEFLDIKTENAGQNIFRISLKLHNKGIFSTCAEIGRNNMWTRVMRISLEAQNGQSLLSGQKVLRINSLDGDQSADFTWLVNGKGPVKITAGALNTGIINTTIDLN